MPDLLKEIGDLELLRRQRKNLMFAACRRVVTTATTPDWMKEVLQEQKRDYPHCWIKSSLPVNLNSDQTVEVPIMVGRDFSTGEPPKSIKLEIQYSKPAKEYEVRVELNGKPLQQIGPYQTYREAYGVEQDWIKLGQNQVTLRQLRGKPIVTYLEIHVQYQ